MGPWLIAAGVNGFVAVAMGAFAAHGLKSVLDAAALAWVETASRYQMTHALALLGVALLIDRDSGPFRWLLRFTAWAFLAGVGLFAGSLYLLALTDVAVFAWVTPLGGLALLLGWTILAWYGVLRWRDRGGDRT